jgi:CheY-like chemotaxis protein
MRILVVEDQESIRNMILALVRARGHDVVAVNTGTKALDVAAEKAPDIVLLDCMLPGHDGIEVCERLRMDPSTRHVPIVMISALADEETKARAMRAGVSAYYTKPFSPTALLAELERLQAAIPT